VASGWAVLAAGLLLITPRVSAAGEWADRTADIAD
jgi:hypothetical protein